MDACCLNRLTDDQSQTRVRKEAVVAAIFALFQEGRAIWVSSTALEVEISRNPDPERRHDVTALLALAKEVVVPHEAVAERAVALERLGFAPFDALHLASAEQGNADVFLTTDDGLLRRAKRHSGRLHTRVQNPLSWYDELAL